MSNVNLAAIGQLPGIEAYNVIYPATLRTPYVPGGTGPPNPSGALLGGGFDCSGLMIYAYTTGPGAPGISLGATSRPIVSDIWNNNSTLTTVYDALTGTGLNGPMDLQFLTGTLIIGDMIIFMASGADPMHQHVMMYAGNGQCIEAPHSGDVVKMTALTYNIGSDEPFRGVKRASGPGSNPTGAGGTSGGNSSQGTGQQLPSSQVGSPKLSEEQQTQLLTQDLPDPRNNLPFSAAFMAYGGTPFYSGTLQRSAKNSKTVIVRGGMVELLANTSSDKSDPTKVTPTARTGGQFACYFMMNPQTISTDCTINTNMAAPSQMNTATLQQGVMFVQNQSINFTIVFNRMYEVWQGGVKGPNGSPGPSDMGVRWDIRAVERLMGIYDASANFPNANGKGYAKGISGNMGLGTNGAGQNPPQSLPLQVVFGGPNSIQFQGMIASLDYTYTMFSSDMIPVEASVDIGIMRLYMPNLSSADIVNPLVTQFGQAGNVSFPYTSKPHSFNANTGLVTAAGAIWL